ncbi:tyrosine-type recombinase/integrase [Alteromonas macleodii]
MTEKKVAYFTIEVVKPANKKNKVRYSVTVREKTCGRVSFSKRKTFDYKAAATKWAKELIHSLENGEKPTDRELQVLTVSELILKYIDKCNRSTKPLGRSAQSSLKQTGRYNIGKVKLVDLRSQHIIDFALERLESERKPKPQTVAGDISFLRSVLIHAKSLFGLEITDQAIVESYPTLRRLRLIAKSDKRHRRLVGKEYEYILEALEEYQSRDKTELPYADLFEMSVLTCLRVSELCRLEWKNLMEEKSLIRVTDRKHPTHKQGNDMLLPLLGKGRALELILKQPRTSKFIFPYNSKTVGTGFRRVIRSLGIVDFQYRDLRREGCSLLIEKGFSLPQVAAVSGHKDLKILHDIYVTVFPETLIHLEMTKTNT